MWDLYFSAASIFTHDDGEQHHVNVMVLDLDGIDCIRYGVGMSCFFGQEKRDSQHWEGDI